MTHSDDEAILVSDEEEGQRLDAFLTQRFTTFSRTYFQTLIEQGLVLVNEHSQKKRYLVCAGDEIDVEFAATEEISLTPEPLHFDILYEDESLLAINKPAGLVVHPGAGNWTGTFVHGLLYHCKQLQGSDHLRPGIVHRLDKETTGVLLAAKTTAVQQQLVDNFSKRLIEKTYLAVCLGNPGNCLLTGRIGRHPTKRQQMAIVPQGGKEAITRVQTLAAHGKFSLVALFPTTGRTHQLRVHLQSIGCPIIGDPVYGIPLVNRNAHATRQLLHAYSLKFLHPLTQQPLIITAPLPSDMAPYFDTSSLSKLH